MARDLGWDGMPFDPDAPIELGQRHAAGTVERKGHVNGKVREPGPSRVASAGPASPNGPDGTLDEVARATRFNSLLVGYSRPPDRSQRSRHCRDSSTKAKPAQEVPAARSIPLSATPSAPVGPTGALVGYSKSPQRTRQSSSGSERMDATDDVAPSFAHSSGPTFMFAFCLAFTLVLALPTVLSSIKAEHGAPSPPTWRTAALVELGLLVLVCPLLLLVVLLRQTSRPYAELDEEDPPVRMCLQQGPPASCLRLGSGALRCQVMAGAGPPLLLRPEALPAPRTPLRRGTSSSLPTLQQSSGISPCITRPQTTGSSSASPEDWLHQID